MEEKFSVRIKELRLERGLSQLQLAKILKYTQSNICEWEKGTVEPKADALLSIADYFSVSIDYLLGRTDEMGELLVIDHSSDFTSKEKKLIANLRKLPKQSQDYVFGIVETLAINS